MIVAARSVEKSSSAQNRPVGQVQPQIARQIAFLALPSGRRNRFAVVQLHQILGEFRIQPRLAIPGARKRFFVQLGAGRFSAQDALNGLDHLATKIILGKRQKNTPIKLCAYLQRQIRTWIRNRGVRGQHHHTQMVLVLELGLAGVRIEAALHADRQPFDLLLWPVDGPSGRRRIAGNRTLLAINVQEHGVLCVLVVVVDMVLAEREKRAQTDVQSSCGFLSGKYMTKLRFRLTSHLKWLIFC